MAEMWRRYRDIEPFLFQLALRRKKSKAKFRLCKCQTVGFVTGIFACPVHHNTSLTSSVVHAVDDPYYCEGSVVHHMNRLGFESVRSTEVLNLHLTSNDFLAYAVATHLHAGVQQKRGLLCCD